MRARHGRLACARAREVVDHLLPRGPDRLSTGQRRVHEVLRELGQLGVAALLRERVQPRGRSACRRGGPASDTLPPAAPRAVAARQPSRAAPDRQPATPRALRTPCGVPQARPGARGRRRARAATARATSAPRSGARSGAATAAPPRRLRGGFVSVGSTGSGISDCRRGAGLPRRTRAQAPSAVRSDARVRVPPARSRPRAAGTSPASAAGRSPTPRASPTRVAPRSPELSERPRLAPDRRRDRRPARSAAAAASSRMRPPRVMRDRARERIAHPQARRADDRSSASARRSWRRHEVVEPAGRRGHARLEGCASCRHRRPRRRLAVHSVSAPLPRSPAPRSVPRAADRCGSCGAGRHSPARRARSFRFVALVVEDHHRVLHLERGEARRAREVASARTRPRSA